MAETDQEELLISITSFLERNKIPYMITGAWSVIYYARPRASHDIDFVVELEKKDIPRVLQSFKELSPEYLIEGNSIKDAVTKKDIFNIIHLPTMLKLDFWLLTDDPFDQSRFARRQKVKILGQQMTIASLEDTILQKLKWYNLGKIEKHLIDAAFVFQIQKKNLNRRYLKKWARKLKLEKYFRQLKELNLEDYL